MCLKLALFLATSCLQSHESPESNHLSYSQMPDLEKSRITRKKENLVFEPQIWTELLLLDT